MNIAYLIRDDGACGYYRMTVPHSELAKKHKVTKIEKGDSADHIEKALSPADVFVCARPSEFQVVEFLKSTQELGKKIVVDYDDDLFSVSPMSAHYQEWGTENIEIDLGGKKAKLWEDGKNFSIAENIARLDNIKRACEVADLITVTQPILAEVYSKYGKTATLPNCIDLNLWNSLPLKKNDDIRLYWSGGASHYEDWAMISEAITILMNTQENLRLVLMGTKFDGTLKGIDKDRIEFHGWVPTPAYPYKTAILNADISIIPLKDTVFNRSKSEIKLVEQSALGVPSVVSNIPPYTDFGNNAVFIENNTVEGWVEGVRFLVDNQIDRWNLGARARETVEQKYDIAKRVSLWEKAYSEL